MQHACLICDSLYDVHDEFFYDQEKLRVCVDCYGIIYEQIQPFIRNVIGKKQYYHVADVLSKKIPKDNTPQLLVNAIKEHLIATKSLPEIFQSTGQIVSNVRYELFELMAYYAVLYTASINRKCEESHAELARRGLKPLINVVETDAQINGAIKLW